MTRHLATVALLSIALLQSSCVALAVGAGVGAGALSHAENAVEEEFEAPLDRTWRASIAALQSLGYAVDTEAQPGPTEGELEVDDVNVRVEVVPEDRSRVRVRAGVFRTDDNIRRAEVVMGAIRKRL